jgi:hypothetical protein
MAGESNEGSSKHGRVAKIGGRKIIEQAVEIVQAQNASKLN